MTWYLLGVKIPNFNIIGWSLWRSCVRCHGVTTSVCALGRFLYHIYYINSDVHRHFLIDGYGIFLSLSRTISYLQTMSMYGVSLSVSSPSLSTMCSVPYMFDPILTIFPTRSLVEGVLIYRVSTCFYLIIPSRNFANRAPCRACYLCYSMQLTCFCFQYGP